MKPEFNKLTLLECVPWSILTKAGLSNTTKAEREAIRDQLFYFQDRLNPKVLQGSLAFLGLLDWFDDWQPTDNSRSQSN